MSKKLKIDLHHAVLPPDLKGRIVKPAVSLNDSAFQYVPAIKTDLAATFRKAFSEIGERVTEKTA